MYTPHEIDRAETLRDALDSAEIQVVPWHGRLAVQIGSHAESFELGQVLRGCKTPEFFSSGVTHFATWPLPYVETADVRMAARQNTTTSQQAGDSADREGWI